MMNPLEAAQAAFLQEWFMDYVSRFRDANGGLEPMLQLKFDHCGRVAAEAVGIASDLGWEPESVRLAKAVGWFHDVGRFSQFTEFKTYNDPLSVDHGQRGCEVLETEGVFGNFPPELARLIRCTVRLHNAKILPNDLSGDSLRYLHLVRDADKIDALRVIDEAISSDRLERHPEICWNVPRHGELNPELLEDLRRGRIGSYSAIRTVDDFQLVLMSWAFDLQFEPSRRRAKREGIFDRMAQRLPDGSGVRSATLNALKALDRPDSNAR